MKRHASGESLERLVCLLGLGERKWVMNVLVVN